ncbi:MAG: histidine triad nucleotide-binding protein [Clostridiales bacterium]|nr:histidine triad nucleotide-binding protein [Clostridiales bacterium]
MDDCIFCKLANGQIPTTFIFEDDLVCCFADLAPQAPTHVLVVPKLHIGSADQVDAQNSHVLAAMFEAIPEIAKRLGVSGCYRLISNCGAEAGQSVPHLHIHLLSGSPTLRDRLI